jgi:hypothetical protein
MNCSATVPAKAALLASLICICCVVSAARAEQRVLSDGLPGDGHMTIRGDQYGAFGPFSVNDAGFGRFNPDGPVGTRPWQFWSGLMLTDGETFRWLMDADDWPGQFGERLLDDNLLADSATSTTRESAFDIPEYEGLFVNLVQETPSSGYNLVQDYTFANTGVEPLSLKLFWMSDMDIEFAQSALDNRVGFVPGNEPRVYFIEDSDVVGDGDPGVADRDRRISVAARTSGDIEFEGALVGRTPIGTGGATHLQYYLQRNHEIPEEFLNTVQELSRCEPCGEPLGSIDFDGDNLADNAGDTSGAMQFSLELPVEGVATLSLNFIGGSLSNSVFMQVEETIDFDSDGDADVNDVDALVGEIVAGTNDATFDVSGDGNVDDADLMSWLSDAATTNGFGQPYLLGDSNLDGTVNANDLNNLGISWQQNVALWSGGDFNADGFVNSGDLNALALNWQSSIPMVAATQNVPEPHTLVILVFGVLGVLLMRTRS